MYFPPILKPGYACSDPHLPRHTAAFAVNAALMTSQCQHRAWTVPLHPTHARRTRAWTFRKCRVSRWPDRTHPTSFVGACSTNCAT